MKDLLKCETCDFWIEEDRVRGECHRYPPNPVWPLTNKNTFCGGHTGWTATIQTESGGQMPKTSKLEKILLIISIVLLASGIAIYAFAANTITYERGTINIVPDGSTDFSWADLTGAPAEGILVYSIQFNPDAANSRIKVRHGTTGGTITWDTNPAGSTAPLIKYYPEGKRLKLVIANSDCTYTTPGSAQIIIEVGDTLR